MQKVLIDVMGADKGVKEIVLGVVKALRNRSFQAIIVGDENEITPLISADILDRVQIVHCIDFIDMSEQAAHAPKRVDSSMYKAYTLLKNGEADALVSPGHSGAMLSLATLRIGRISGVSRPAICTTMPTITERKSLVIDVGANTDCKPEYLRDFALLGYTYSKHVLGIESPRVGLLSNGEEDSKGNELVKTTHTLLKPYPFFRGNVEGRDIFNGSTDVIVCDGFSGNLVLKASEGVADAFSKLIKQEVKKSIISILGALLIKRVFKILKKKLNHSEYGGAPLLGVKKVVIISHGSSDSRAIECAIYQALDTLDSNIIGILEKTFANSIK